VSLEEKLHRNLQAIHGRIRDAANRAGRDPGGVTLVAVTKSVGLREIEILRDLGLRHFGENRVGPARDKIVQLGDSALTWHMVGNVQRRKVKDVLQLFDTIDTVDRLPLAEALQGRCEAVDAHCRVLIEVNISGEGQKLGFSPQSLPAALSAIADLDRVHVDGLMTMATQGLDPGGLRRLFRELHGLAGAHGLPVVSMGMSEDFEEAVEAGATQVRIGRALFE